MEDKIKIEISRDHAQYIQHGLSDIACWMSGYLAATPDSSYKPLGLEEIRSMNILLKGALNAETKR